VKLSVLSAQPEFTQHRPKLITKSNKSLSEKVLRFTFLTAAY